MFGVFPIATPQFGDAINSPGSRTKRYRKELLVECNLRACSTVFAPDVELYNFQDAAFFNSRTISILVNCPPGRQCAPGTYPKVFNYPRGTFVIPDPGPCSGFPIILQLAGCQSLIIRSVPCGSSSAVIQAAADVVIQLAAQQQAECDALADTNNEPTPTFVNQAQYEVVACAEDELLTYTGILPSYLTLDVVNSRVVFTAGIIGGDTQAAANATATTLLHNFVVAAEADDSLKCVAATDCPDWNTLLWGVPTIFEANATASFSPDSMAQDNFAVSAATDIFFEALGEAENTATIDYNGTGCACTLNVVVVSASGASASVVITSSDAGELLTADLFGLTPGSYDYPFIIPDTLGSNTTITVAGSATATSDGVTATAISITGSIACP